MVRMMIFDKYFNFL